MGTNGECSVSNTVIYDIHAIQAILPHRPPFLFVDRIIELIPDVSIVAERDVKSEEFYFSGHFPGNPVMPGVLIADALAQTSGLLYGFSKKRRLDSQNLGQETTQQLFSLASVDMKFMSPAYPGETLRLFAAMNKRFGDLFNYSVEASVGKRLIAKGFLTLAKSETIA